MSRIEREKKWRSFKNKRKVNRHATIIIRKIKFMVIWPIKSLLYCRYRTVRLFLLKKGILKKNKNDCLLNDLKNSHRGETAFVIGNGPSLLPRDLEMIHAKRGYSFGCNRINAIFEETKWRPNCYSAIDKRLLFDGDFTIEEMFDENIDYYFFSKALYKCIPKCPKGKKIAYINFKPVNFYKNEIEFGEDPNKYFIDGYTVTNLSIQMAVYMGFKRICLLGIDCKYANESNENGEIVHHSGVKTYFGTKRKEVEQNVGFVTGMLQAYKVAKRFCEENKIEIYNCSKNSYFNIFDYRELKSILENKT